MNPIIEFFKKTDLFDRIGFTILAILLIVFFSFFSTKIKNTANSETQVVTPTPAINQDFLVSAQADDLVAVSGQIATETITATPSSQPTEKPLPTSTPAPTLTLAPTLTPLPTSTPIPTIFLTPTQVPIKITIFTPTLVPTIKPVTVPPAGIRVSTNNVSLHSGEKQPVIATVLPGNASNKSITWLYDGNIISVDSSGLITAKNKGQTTITVKTSNNKTNLIYVIVN